ncbi:MAG: hypothetical protein GXO31_03700 [Epsilonproteobacteria bacterium]|nr:hypothetical protein [Campylobacterota bacterium]
MKNKLSAAKIVDRVGTKLQRKYLVAINRKKVNIEELEFFNELIEKFGTKREKESWKKYTVGYKKVNEEVEEIEEISKPVKKPVQIDKEEETRAKPPKQIRKLFRRRR